MNGGPDLASMKATLTAHAVTPPEAPVHIRAFVAWMRSAEPVSVDIAAEVAGAVGAARSGTHVAALGFASQAAGKPILAPETVFDWVSWLRSRRYFVPGRPRTFEHDGLAILGVALALRAVDADPEALMWLDTLASESLGAFERGAWDWSLIATARVVLGVTDREDVVTQVLPELRVALTAKGVLAGHSGAGNAAWATILRLEALSGGVAHAAVLLAAFNQLVSESLPARLSNVELVDVCRILHGVHASLRRWPWEAKGRTPRSAPARWDVENEYHVQDLLWIVLAPLFPDLEDEENLVSVGHKHPRADLAIPSLNLIIEVKFIRPAASFADMIGGVSEDTGLYFCKESRWRQMIAFIWDDSGRTEEHQELRQGLLKLPNMVDAIIVPRPAKMARVQGAGGAAPPEAT